MGKNDLAIFLHMIAELNDRARRERFQYRLEQLLAPIEADAADVDALDIEKIEDEKSEPVLAARFEVGLQARESRYPVVVLNHALGGKLRIGASAQEGGHLLRDDVGLALLPCKFILGLDEEPWVFLLARFSAHAHEMPAALEARAVKGEIEMAFGKSVVGIEFRPPGAAIPHDHGAAAIFALGDDTLPVEILHRVVFGFNRQALVVGIKARAAGHGPALENAIELEPQIEMEAPRIMPLHHELPALGLARLGLGLRGL